jgi:hypothetical protein
MNARLLRPIASGSFDPRTIPGLSSWLDFSDSTTLGPDHTGLGAVSTGNPIGYALDKANGTNFYSESNSTLRPNWGTINGRGAADYWGPNLGPHGDQLIRNANVSMIEFTAVVTWDLGVGTTFANSNFATIFSSGGGPWGGGFNASVWAAAGGGAVGQVWFMNNTETLTQPAVAFPPLGNGLPAVVQGWAASVVNAASPRLGNDRGNATRGWPGRIGEWLTYSVALSPAQRAAIRRGLIRKWGIV